MEQWIRTEHSLCDRISSRSKSSSLSQNLICTFIDEGMPGCQWSGDLACIDRRNFSYLDSRTHGSHDRVSPVTRKKKQSHGTHDTSDAQSGAGLLLWSSGQAELRNQAARHFWISNIYSRRVTAEFARYQRHQECLWQFLVCD